MNGCSECNRAWDASGGWCSRAFDGSDVDFERELFNTEWAGGSEDGRGSDCRDGFGVLGASGVEEYRQFIVK